MSGHMRPEAIVISTYASYKLVTRDIAVSLDRVASQPMIQRETDYFRENIGKVKSIDEFVNDYRLFNYAMKAHGLSDMAYAKAFMKKALEEGLSDPNSFANKLSDKRYVDFVRSFNFEAHGAQATSYNPAVEGTQNLFVTRTSDEGIPREAIERETAHFASRIGEIRSARELVADDRLLSYVLYAFELEGSFGDKESLIKVMEGGTGEGSPGETIADGKFKVLAAAFDFEQRGPETTTWRAAIDGTVSKFMRQSLEEDAGQQNEGVRLALYFERKIGSVSNAYQLLGDRALAQVVRTALGLPEAMAQANIDSQAKLIENRMDLDKLKDPKELEKFLTRFATMWEIENPSRGASSPVLQLFQPTEYGISPDTMMALAQLRK